MSQICGNSKFIHFCLPTISGKLKCAQFTMPTNSGKQKCTNLELPTSRGMVKCTNLVLPMSGGIVKCEHFGFPTSCGLCVSFFICQKQNFQNFRMNRIYQIHFNPMSLYSAIFASLLTKIQSFAIH